MDISPKILQLATLKYAAFVSCDLETAHLSISFLTVCSFINGITASMVSIQALAMIGSRFSIPCKICTTKKSITVTDKTRYVSYLWYEINRHVHVHQYIEHSAHSQIEL